MARQRRPRAPVSFGARSANAGTRPARGTAASWPRPRSRARANMLAKRSRCHPLQQCATRGAVAGRTSVAPFAPGVCWHLDGPRRGRRPPAVALNRRARRRRQFEVTSLRLVPLSEEAAAPASRARPRRPVCRRRTYAWRWSRRAAARTPGSSTWCAPRGQPRLRIAPCAPRRPGCRSSAAAVLTRPLRARPDFLRNNALCPFSSASDAPGGGVCEFKRPGGVLGDGTASWSARRPCLNLASRARGGNPLAPSTTARASRARRSSCCRVCSSWAFSARARGAATTSSRATRR